MTSKITKPSCMDCPYFHDLRGQKYTYAGQCRRRSPRQTVGDITDWALVELEEWCGDHPNFEWWIKESKNET